ncbi:MAG: tetratricopeptide repeat protein, partial [Acidobacteriaceae bacterium]|nr:tetratricopeptide repeat protein [Acidobacteriaceae bacterium]
AALTLTPNDADLLLSRAGVYSHVGRHREALQDRDAAVKLRPTFAAAYIARGGSYHELGMHDRGLADRTEAIRLDPNLPEAWFARGSAYYLLGDFGRSAEDLREAVRLRPGYREAADVLLKAEKRIDENRKDASQGPLLASVEAKPRLSQSAAELERNGRKLSEAGQYREAIELFNQALQADASAATAYNARGYAWLCIREYGHALEDFNTAIAMNPVYRNAYHNRAAVKRLMRDSAGAAEDLRIEQTLPAH